MQVGKPSVYLSTVEAAGALGVSVSTVKRWVDEGVLPAHRTAGGHRKLLRAEVLALARQSDLPRGNLAPLGVGGDLSEVAASLQSRLLTGQGGEVRAILGQAYALGTSVEALADEVIAPAMAGVGHDWEAARIDVWQEHRGTQLCLAGLHELKEQLDARAERNRPLAIGGAPEGDPYLVATLLAQLVSLDAGWEAVNFGPNTPLTSFAKAIRQLRPRLLWLSVSHLEDRPRFLRAYQELYREAEQHGVAVAVGGQALDEATRSAISYTTHGDGMRHLAAFARALHPRVRRPRRGRPPGPGSAGQGRR
jgi:excisionase family DNA binding protein